MSYVHPVVGVPPPAFNVVAPSTAGTKDLQGMPGTAGSLALRVLQFGFAAIALSVMASISDFQTVTAFCYLVVGTGLQSLWSLSMAALDGYALLLKRSIRRSSLVTLFAVGDWLCATLTLAAACSTAGITVLLAKDLDQCGPNDCSKLQASVALTFLAWFLSSCSFFFSFWVMATS
ncbi:hypothetical protein SELMODRAFT_97617 [Selaginella moellendorffii]|uniref:CASP-like protein n=1 Tax=Selaginella moellendorffii TaxID=88036 RepID=D8RMG3_SELML|nr:CASP-like protein 5A2 [Selaginella moellendorffii]EFJ26335.1 hypothetical protein SELMODRAFT_97617 [Selaginella moellendorffii]|eukprot:XP_002972249.1 CASP-like protein 5A2 [Selaginella moellendorffii]